MKKILLSIILLLIVNPSQAQENTTLQKILSLPPEEFAAVSLRIGYLGAQERSLMPLMVAIDGHDINWNAFRGVSGLQISDYETQKTDASKPSFTVTPDDMRKFLDNVAQFSNQKTLDDGYPLISLAVVVGRDEKPFGFVQNFNQQQAGDVFVYLRNAFRADPKDITIINGGINAGAMNELQSFGCAIGLLSSAIPAKDTSEQIGVTRGGLRFDHKTQKFETNLTLKNVSSEPVRGPVSVVLDMTPNVYVTNAHGRTCITSPVGREFITLPMPQETLNPGQVLETIVHFAGTEGEDIDFTTKILSGPGER